jgi:hypothetical protein
MSLTHHLLHDVSFETEVAGLGALDYVVEVEYEDIGSQSDDS